MAAQEKGAQWLGYTIFWLLPMTVVCVHRLTVVQVLEGNTANPNYGYNAANDKYGDLIEAGIIDPTKV